MMSKFLSAWWHFLIRNARICTFRVWACGLSTIVPRLHDQDSNPDPFGWRPKGFKTGGADEDLLSNYK